MKYKVGNIYLVRGNDLKLQNRIPCIKRKEDNHQTYCKGFVGFGSERAFCGYLNKEPLFKEPPNFTTKGEIQQRATVEEILEKLRESEIRFHMLFSSSKIIVFLDNFAPLKSLQTTQEATVWLAKQAVKHYPESAFRKWWLGGEDV